MIESLMIEKTIQIRWLGSQDYLCTWEAMQQFTQHRDAETQDEIWMLEHHPVFTQGQNGKAEHLLHPGSIPVIQTDRGGQITYHGPGQLMVYTLIDIKRKKWSIRQFVSLLEQSIIDLLAAYHIEAEAKCKAPGVYIQGKKICSIGLRIRRGAAYHGIAFNIGMDLSPFTRINPCGFATLQMTQCSEWSGLKTTTEASRQLIPYLVHHLGYTNAHFIDSTSGPIDGN
jgi:lipoyl(octanoyl) transferase